MNTHEIRKKETGISGAPALRYKRNLAKHFEDFNDFDGYGWAKVDRMGMASTKDLYCFILFSCM